MLNIKYLYIKYIFFIFLFFSLGCGKKNNTKLAQNYYKLSILELGDQPDAQSFKKSLEFIEKAISQENRAEYLALKATLLFKLGNTQEGLETFDLALALDPEAKIKTEILNNKACLLAQAGIKENNQKKLSQAFSLWQTLQKNKDYLTPEVALVNMGIICSEQQKFNDAKNYYIKAVNVAPGYLDAHYYLALSAYELKDQNLARNEIDTVLFMERDHIGAKKLKSFLL